MSEQRNFLIDNSYKSIKLRKILKLIFKKKKREESVTTISLGIKEI